MDQSIFQIFIEIPQGSAIKYEWDEHLDRLIIDRILPTSMVFPINYGYIIGTVGADSDPIDAMVLTSQIPVPGAVIRCRIIGALDMEDEKGHDPKIMCIPLDSIDPEFSNIKDIDHLSLAKKEMLAHFFAHYKDLDSNKWVKIKGWVPAGQALTFIK